MAFTNQQLLDKTNEGVITDVSVAFSALLLESFMSVFGKCDPDNTTEDCDEDTMSFQFFDHPALRAEQVTEWAETTDGLVSVITCHTLHDENNSSYCDIYVNKDYKDGEFMTLGTDYDDTFGDQELSM